MLLANMNIVLMDYDLYDDYQLIDGILANDNDTIEYFLHKKCSPMFLYIITNIFDNNIDLRELINELYLLPKMTGK